MDNFRRPGAWHTSHCPPARLLFRRLAPAETKAASAAPSTSHGQAFCLSHRKDTTKVRARLLIGEAWDPFNRLSFSMITAQRLNENTSITRMGKEVGRTGGCTLSIPTKGELAVDIELFPRIAPHLAISREEGLDILGGVVSGTGPFSGDELFADVESDCLGIISFDLCSLSHARLLREGWHGVA